MSQSSNPVRIGLAGYGIGVRLEFMLGPVVFGVGSGLTTIVGVAVGAGGHDARGVLRVNLRNGAIRNHPVGVLERTDDVRLTFNTHLTPEGIFSSKSVSA